MGEAGAANAEAGPMRALRMPMMMVLQQFMLPMGPWLIPSPGTPGEGRVRVISRARCARVAAPVAQHNVRTGGLLPVGPLIGSANASNRTATDLVCHPMANRNSRLSDFFYH